MDGRLRMVLKKTKGIELQAKSDIEKDTMLVQTIEVDPEKVQKISPHERMHATYHYPYDNALKWKLIEDSQWK